MKKRGRFQKAFYSRETDFLRETHLLKTKPVCGEKGGRLLAIAAPMNGSGPDSLSLGGELLLSDL